MNQNRVGKGENQSLITRWSQQNDVQEFVSAGDVSANVLRRLRGLEKDGLVWHQVMTNAEGWLITPGVDWFDQCQFCAQLPHLNSKCSGSKGLGWTSLGFFVANKSSPMWDSFGVPDRFPCDLCNSDGSYNSLDENCSDCEGAGDVHHDYQWPGRPGTPILQRERVKLNLTKSATTSFSSKAEILGDLWMDYRTDEKFQDFIEYNDLGLPLAYAVSALLVEPMPLAEQYINETFDLLISSLGLTDTGFETLEEILASARKGES